MLAEDTGGAFRLALSQTHEAGEPFEERGSVGTRPTVVCDVGAAQGDVGATLGAVVVIATTDDVDEVIFGWLRLRACWLDGHRLGHPTSGRSPTNRSADRMSASTGSPVVKISA